MSASSSASLARNFSIWRTAWITVVWSRPPKRRPMSGSDLRRQLLGQIHRHLARAGHLARPAGRGHLRLADAVMLGDLGLDLVDRDPPLVGAQDIGQHFLDEGKVDRPAGHHRIGGDPVERAFELADWSGHPAGEELDDVRAACRRRAAPQLGLDDIEAKLEIGGVDVGDQAPGQARQDRGANPSRSCGARSEVITSRRPAVMISFIVWKNSSCVESLPAMNWTSSISSRSAVRNRLLKPIVSFPSLRG